jgi:hypothetical protein
MSFFFPEMLTAAALPSRIFVASGYRPSSCRQAVFLTAVNSLPPWIHRICRMTAISRVHTDCLMPDTAAGQAAPRICNPGSARLLWLIDPWHGMYPGRSTGHAHPLSPEPVYIHGPGYAGLPIIRVGVPAGHIHGM